MVGGDTNPYYRDFIRAMTEIGYEGYIELRALPPVARRRMARRSTSDIAHQNAQLAAEFMRELIDAELVPARGS